MSSEYLEALGEKIALEGLELPRTQALASFLKTRVNPHAELIEVRRIAETHEVVVFDVDVEVSQLRANDVRPKERLSAAFEVRDDTVPEILALRSNFPFVPHLNPREEEYPRSLCLYDQTFDELKLTWTPAAFVERVRWWLRETAKGTLHQEDQPLEPLLVGNFPPLVLPSDFLKSICMNDKPQPLNIGVGTVGKGQVFVAERDSSRRFRPGFLATGFCCPPHTHGVVRARPKSLKQLSEILAGTQLELISGLRDRLNQWQLSAELLASFLILVIVLPKQRQSGGEIEHNERWAFLLSKDVSQLGTALGLWEVRNGTVGGILGGTVSERLIDEIGVDVLNPMFTLSRSGAAALNGTSPSSLRIAVIGLGALGSQVVTNLVRSGFGVWMGIDEDFVLPHNAARHELTQWEVGMPKVHGVQLRLNAILDEAAMPRALETNVLQPGANRGPLEEALTDSDVILDLSASLAVGRKLAHYPDNNIRRCSIFLNPSGSDLVLLCEDQARKVRLDWLEFQYYRALLDQKDFADHFRQEPGRIRYAQSCRDLTSTVPQHVVAMYSGIAARALQQCLIQDEAMLRIWHSDDALNVRAHRIEQFPALQVGIEGWQIQTDEAFVQKIVRYRKNRLPKETGGVLVGGFDQQNRIVYLVDVIPSPPDSEEWPTLYIRGKQGLEGAVTQVRERTDGQLQYMGEWHSHPKGHSTEPSTDDRRVLDWLATHTARDGNPPVMLIVGEKDIRIFLGSIDHWVMIRQAKR